jgi:hypothetical protein
VMYVHTYRPSVLGSFGYRYWVWWMVNGWVSRDAKGVLVSNVSCPMGRGEDRKKQYIIKTGLSGFCPGHGN